MIKQEFDKIIERVKAANNPLNEFKFFVYSTGAEQFCKENKLDYIRLPLSYKSKNFDDNEMFVVPKENLELKGVL